MRKALFPVILALLLAATAFFPGCTVTDLGKVVTEEKDFTDFTYVTVEGNFDVEIIPAESYNVTISANENLADYVTVSREGQVLRIYLSPRHTFTDFTLSGKVLKATITMPNLYGLELSGASKAKASGFKSSHDLRLDISGASSIQMDDIEVRDAELKISGASKVSGSIDATNADFEVSGASKIDLQGSADTLRLDASGASQINLSNLPLDNAGVKLSGASQATVNTKGRLDADLSGASSLYFLGNPTIGDISVTGASTIKHE